jgi:O-antigen/teichoic acid export membrane protein
MSSQTPNASDPPDYVGRRVAEGVATNLITAAILWLIASLAGIVAGNPALTAAASGVIAGAVVTLAVAWILRDRKRLWFLRSTVNWLNGSTPLGMIIAGLGGGASPGI